VMFKSPVFSPPHTPSHRRRWAFLRVRGYKDDCNWVTIDGRGQLVIPYTLDNKGHEASAPPRLQHRRGILKF